MADDEKPFATDDAVSNRSDDTALDEGEGAQANGRELSADEQAGQAAAPPESVGHAEQIEQSAEPVADEGSPESEQLAEEAETAAEPVVAPRGPIEETPEEPEDIHLDWFILKVQSNRERSIADALTRKMKIEGYE